MRESAEAASDIPIVFKLGVNHLFELVKGFGVDDLVAHLGVIRNGRARGRWRRKGWRRST